MLARNIIISLLFLYSCSYRISDLSEIGKLINAIPNHYEVVYKKDMFSKQSYWPYILLDIVCDH